MDKRTLVEALCTKTECTKKEATAFLDAFVEVLTETLKEGDFLRLAGLGTFDLRHREERMAFNPRNPKEKILVPAKTVPVFKPSSVLKDTVKDTVLKK